MADWKTSPPSSSGLARTSLSSGTLDDGELRLIVYPLMAGEGKALVAKTGVVEG